MFRKLTPTLLVLGALTLFGCPDAKPKTPHDDDSASDGEANGSTDATPPIVTKAAPFDIEAARTPWKHSKVGDWAVYNMHGSGKILRFEITGVDGQFVKFTVKDEKSGKLINDVEINMAEENERYKDPMTYDGMARDKDGNEIKPYTEAIEIKGKTIEALVIKRAGLGSTTELWIAEKDVRPFNQCAVKSFKDGALKIELMDFGGK